MLNNSVKLDNIGIILDDCGKSGVLNLRLLFGI